MRKIAFLAALLSLCASPLFAAPGGGTVLPPSAVLFNTTYPFVHTTDTYTANATAPADGAWLSGKATWSTNGFLFGWDCVHSYSATLAPNNNDYSPLFIADWTPAGICSDQPPVYGCLNCGIDWGGAKSFQYMTTSNTPGFLAPGGGTITLQSNNGGGQNDQITLNLQQVNRDQMVNMTIFQSLDTNDPTPASSTEVAAAYFIANTADRVPVVPVFHYGVDASGADVQYPAGPSVTYVATWDSGQTSTPDVAFAPHMLHGHTILGVPVPKMATGSHTFTIKATLPSGKSYTSPSMTVFVYAQVIYLTYANNFDPKHPTDDLPKFVPGQDVSGNQVDLRTAVQTVQLNILIPKGSSGTFELHLRDVTRYPGIAMNYPISNPDTNPDLDFGGQVIDQTGLQIPHGGGPKFYTVPLQIHDYAGSASVEVTMPYKKTTFTARRRVPLDDDNNGLPDAGWNTPHGHVNAGDIQSASDDLEAAPAGPTQAGDGLSAFEEYRGFFIQGHYERLDPNARDLFIDADSGVDTSFLAHLPYRVHSIDAGDSLGTDLQRGTTTIARTKPVIDPNRSATGGTTVPGSQANGQRAIRLVYTSKDYPTKVDPIDSTNYPVWQFGIRGITWQDGMSIEPFDESQATAFSGLSPNSIRFVEIFSRSQQNAIIHMGGGTNQIPQPVYLDENGQPVPDCNDPNTPAGTPCDQYLNGQGIVAFEMLPQGNLSATRFVLHSRLTFQGDYYTKFAHASCGSSNLSEVSQSDYAFLSSVVVAHETGHELALDHTGNCGEVMFGLGGLMPDNLPYPTDYTSTERGGMRAHQ